MPNACIYTMLVLLKTLPFDVSILRLIENPKQMTNINEKLIEHYRWHLMVLNIKKWK
jgi:hypothetical protein